MTTLLWFTHDLRLTDNAALNAAAKLGQPILPVYWVGTNNPAAPSGAALWWLHHSLTQLNKRLITTQTKGHAHGELLVVQGDITALLDVAQQHGCQAIHFSCSHEPWLAQQQQTLNTLAQAAGITCRQFTGQLLTQPASILNKQGKPFQVFTPYYKHCLQLLQPPTASPAPKKLVWQAHSVEFTQQLAALNWLPKQPNWAQGFTPQWQPGEAGAITRLNNIISHLDHYPQERDTPSLDGTSCLSPHLHFGEISPRYIWQQVTQQWPQGQGAAYLRQLMWREFNYYLLHHYPHITHAPFKASFTRFPWQPANANSAALQRWQNGQTGYPLVDAGMRQLWQTGWMHNRVRMVVASFLTKHLQLHWQVGERWFWETLLDADQANNCGGWQWVAGCGADAAPYFRIFNPVIQSQKFDPNGDYIRQYLPELALLPNKYLHAPWLAPANLLADAGITLGRHYPHPIVDHSAARAAALTAYAQLKENP